THDVAVPNVNFTIQGSGLANVDTILFRFAADGSIDNDISVRACSVVASDSQVTAKIDISENAASVVRRASVHPSDGQTSNDRDLQIDGCQSPADGEPPLFQSLQQLRRGYRVDLYSKFFSQGPEPGTILFTPVADGTVQQLDMVSQAGPGRSIVT